MTPAVIDKPRTRPLGPSVDGPGGFPPIDPPSGVPPFPNRHPDEVPGLRCSNEDINWPPAPALFGFEPSVSGKLALNAAIVDGRPPACPSCRGELSPASNVVTISLDEAWSIKNHADFDRYYARTRPGSRG